MFRKCLKPNLKDQNQKTENEVPEIFSKVINRKKKNSQTEYINSMINIRLFKMDSPHKVIMRSIEFILVSWKT